MSFVTTQPEALTAAAGNLQGIGSTLAAQNAAAAPPTIDVVPAAADEVSALQATQFAAYGNLYQQVSAQAAAIHEMFVRTLGTSAGSYATAEAVNSSAAGSSGSGLSGFLGGLTGSGSSSSGALGMLSSMSGTGGYAATAQVGNFGAAASDFAQLGSAGFVTGEEPRGIAALGAGSLGAGLADAVGPASPAGFVGAPVSAGLGQASSLGGMSVPPSWAAQATPAAVPAPGTSAGAGWTTAAPQHTTVGTVPAGMPPAASAGRAGFGFGTPKYGIKPTVMPRPAAV